MDTSRANLLGELALDADLERGDHIRVAAEQMLRFLDANRDRIGALGGLTLIDDDPDFLAVQPDLTFRIQSRFQDADTGEWRAEMEVVDAPELVELYNPADVYAAFAEAARALGGLAADEAAPSMAESDEDEDAEDDEADDVVASPGVHELDAEPAGTDGGLYAAAADEWAATRPTAVHAEDEDSAAHALYDLALEYQERSQESEARLLGAFESASATLAGLIGDFVIVDDDDERLTLDANGTLRAEVVPEDGDGEWRALQTPTQLVEYYDPTDVFGDLADALAEAYPGVAPNGEADDEADDDDASEDDDAGGDAADADDDAAADAADADTDDEG